MLHADAANASLTPEMLMRACAELQPTVLNTTPWMVEGFCELLESGTMSAACFDSLHFLTYGGAALKPNCGAVLRRFKISAKCTYGQTELGGAVCFGKVNGDLNALTPLPGIQFKIDYDDDDTGELILEGAYCATTGYRTYRLHVYFVIARFL